MKSLNSMMSIPVNQLEKGHPEGFQIRQFIYGSADDVPVELHQQIHRDSHFLFLL